MSQNDNLQPEEIKLHQKSRLLTIRFPDGKTFHLPCEYLRVCSPAAEVVASDLPEAGKEKVNIVNLEPQGTYALRIEFDDGHDTGIYSWDTLYELGRDHERNWQAYLERLAAAGVERREPPQAEKRVRLLYFAWMAKKFRKESEELVLPAKVADVQSLLKMLKLRKPQFAPLLEEDQVRVTVNRQFTEPFTRIEDGDEVALVPTSPTPPPTPDL